MQQEMAQESLLVWLLRCELMSELGVLVETMVSSPMDVLVYLLVSVPVFVLVLMSVLMLI